MADEDLSSGTSSDSDIESDECNAAGYLNTQNTLHNLFTYQLTQPLGSWEKHTRVIQSVFYL